MPRTISAGREADIRDLAKYEKTFATENDLLKELDAERDAHYELRSQLAETIQAAEKLAEALATLKEDFADADGCYCGQIIGGIKTDGEPLGICGHCLARAALAQYAAVMNPVQTIHK